LPRGVVGLSQQVVAVDRVGHLVGIVREVRHSFGGAEIASLIQLRRCGYGKNNLTQCRSGLARR
jgi:hypothetical protein